MMRHNGSNQFLNLGTLPLAGSIPQATQTTLTISHPFIKARDAVALSWTDFDVGTATGSLLQGYVTRDGALDLLFYGNSDSTRILDTSMTVGLLRSPGNPNQVTPIGDAQLGPALPLYHATANNTTNGLTLLPTESGLISFPFVAPHGPGEVLPLVINGPVTIADLIVLGWRHNPASDTVQIAVQNIGIGNVTINANDTQVTMMALAGRNTPYSARVSAQGGGTMGRVHRWAATVGWPESLVAIGAAPANMQSSMNGGTGGADQTVPNRPTGYTRVIAHDLGFPVGAGVDVGLNSLPTWLPTNSGFQATAQGVTAGPVNVAVKGITSHCIICDLAD